MEKQIPHHNLDEVKRLIRAGMVEATSVAIQGAFDLGMGYKDVLNTALSLTRNDFYKSMTSYKDHRSWQDVYHTEMAGYKIYLKLTIQDGVVILSFKEL
jgi:motility quorum-sensing regulator/GCU-specific mRNA interferase toxin